MAEGGYNNKTRKSTWIPLLIRSKSQRRNSDSCDTLMYRAPACINLQHPVTLMYLLVLCYSKRGMLFFISSVCLLVWQLCASAPIHSTRLLSCHCHTAPSVQTTLFQECSQSFWPLPGAESQAPHARLPGPTAVCIPDWHWHWGFHHLPASQSLHAPGGPQSTVRIMFFHFTGAFKSAPASPAGWEALSDADWSGPAGMDYRLSQTDHSMSGCETACQMWWQATLAHPRELFSHCFCSPSTPLTSATTPRHSTCRGSLLTSPLLDVPQTIRWGIQGSGWELCRMVWQKPPFAQHRENQELAVDFQGRKRPP